MFLEYGITDDGELVRIDQVARGRLAGVNCPYCHRSLLARKGALKAPHFAHDGETCAAASRDTDAISLPVYDRFLLHLSGRELQALRYYHGLENEWDGVGRDRDALQHKGLLVFNEFNGRDGNYELTKLGKIPLGALSLMLFNQVQEPLIRERQAALEATAHKALGTADFETALIDLRLYRAQWQRILALTLYFIEITHASGVLYKIGVTNRTVEERAVEIAADLRPHIGDVTLKVLGTWAHRGNVERYFKHRYAAQQYRLGSLTEYLRFDDSSPVLRDLRRMKLKALDEDEQAILAGAPSAIERGTPSADQLLSLAAWRMLEQYAVDNAQFPMPKDREEGKIYDELHFPGYAVTDWESDFRNRRGNITERGKYYHRYFSSFYHERYAAHYEAQERAQRAERKRAAIRTAMRQAAAEGKHVGRPADDPAAFLNKPQSQAIRTALARGLSLR